MLRQFAPQFAERSRTSGQFAQQDARKLGPLLSMLWKVIYWLVMLQRDTLSHRLEREDSLLSSCQEKWLKRESLNSSFIESMNWPWPYSEFESLKCSEAPEEASTSSTENFLEIKCNISSTTNYMMTGISEVRLDLRWLMFVATLMRFTFPGYGPRYWEE